MNQNFLTPVSHLTQIATIQAYKQPHARLMLARALDLAESGKVAIFPNPRAPILATVGSAATEEAYQITSGHVDIIDASGERKKAPGLRCDCKAYSFSPTYINTRPYCKHIAAALFVHQANKQQEAEDAIMEEWPA